MTLMQQITSAQASAEIPINENFATLSAWAIFGKRPVATSGLTFGYYGGLWGGNAVADGTVSLLPSSTNRIVANRSTGEVSLADGSPDLWADTENYAKLYSIVTGASSVTSTQDLRAGPGGMFAGAGTEVTPTTQCIPIACSDETTAITTGATKVTFRMPFGFVLSEVRASLTTAQASGSIFTVDINESGSTILSTKLSVDNTEKTSKTASTPAVISDASLSDDAEITIDVDQVGDGTAKGLKIYLIGIKQ